MIKKYSMATIAIISLVIIFGITEANADPGDTESKNDTYKILAAKFEPRQIVQIESGDFHFKPWQIGPVHTHPALCIGYIAKGTIIYQVEGEKPQMLRTGDVFYEPAGPRIMRFDNASATGETIFIDFCPEQAGETFILFEKTPTEFIDRRALSTLTLEHPKSIDQFVIFEHTLQPNGRKNLNHQKSLISGYVAEGEIELRSDGEVTQRIKAGENFYQLAGHSHTLLINISPKTPARVITFNLQ